MSVQPSREKLIELAKAVAKREEVDPELLCSIAEVESSWNLFAARFESQYIYQVKAASHAKKNGITEETEFRLQSFSWGLCQIMGGTARDMKLEGSILRLLEPELNLTYACKYLHALSPRCATISDLVSAYNHGSPWHDGTNPSLYKNQGYVDKIEKAMIKYI